MQWTPISTKGCDDGFVAFEMITTNESRPRTMTVRIRPAESGRALKVELRFDDEGFSASDIKLLPWSRLIQMADAFERYSTTNPYGRDSTND